ncbi:hypothetical protein V8D89_009570, partial [Ganoderma adspersum]
MSPVNWPAVLSSDYFLASMLPLVLLVLSLQILGRPADLLGIILGRTCRSAHASVSHFSESMQRPAASYTQYSGLARAELAAMRTVYQCMGWANRRPGIVVVPPEMHEGLEGVTKCVGDLREVGGEAMVYGMVHIVTHGL